MIQAKRLFRIRKAIFCHTKCCTMECRILKLKYGRKHRDEFFNYYTTCIVKLQGLDWGTKGIKLCTNTSTELL